MMIALHCGAVLVLALGSWLLGFRMGVKYLTHALVQQGNRKALAAIQDVADWKAAAAKARGGLAEAEAQARARAEAQAEHMKNPRHVKHWPYRMH